MKNFFLIFCLFLITVSCNNLNNESRPNFIVIFVDDLGYGDLGSYGHPTIKTPTLDRLSYEGQKWTQFYSASSVCTPSRAALLTGRLPIRNGMIGSKTRVFFPDSQYGIPDSEITIAEKLKENGYKNAIIGKWHLGHKKEYLPLQHGFDYYFGIPYSNDMDPINGVTCCPGPRYWQQYEKKRPDSSNYNVPLIENNNIIERPADQTTITKRYSDKAVEFIRDNKKNNFFLYLAHNLPHTPLYASDEFTGKSKRGLYGDVVEEIDHGIGRIIDELERNNLDRNTIVIFTSDNGPWLSYGNHSGSSGIYREGKGTTWEGGVRVPSIIKFPNGLKPSEIDEPIMAIDWMPTFANITRSKLSQNKIDGKDIWPLLSGEVNQSPHEKLYFYYRVNELHSIRMNDWKIQFSRTYRSLNGKDGGKDGIPVKYEMNLIDKNELYNLKDDPQERIDVYDKFPEIAKKMEELAEKARVELGDNLKGRKGKGNRLSKN